MLIKRKRIPILRIITEGLWPSFIKKFYYRLRGAHIGKAVHISLGSVFIGNNIEIGDYTSIGFASIIRGREIRIGRNVEIGSMVFIDVNHIDIDDDVLLREQVLIGGLGTTDSSFKIGKRSHIRQKCCIYTSKPVKIGCDTAIGGNSLIFTHSSWQSVLEGYPCTFAPVVIKDNVWVSWDVFILPGVTIESGALVTPGSVVTRDIPEKSVARGNPAKVIMPCGSFPRQIDSSERDSIVRKILDEFWIYLQDFGFQMQKENTTPYLTVKVHKKKPVSLFPGRSVYNFLYLPNQIRNLKRQYMDALSLCLSLDVMEDSFRTKLLESGCMWADLSTRQRGGTDEFGEELLRFLARFGIRFERTD